MTTKSRRLLILINGAAPGLGKSSLAKELVARMELIGWDVELFEEQDILEHADFAAVIQAWRSGGNVDSSTLLAATKAYLSSCWVQGADVHVQDSLLPFLPSLLAWGWSDYDIASFFSELGVSMRDFQVLQVQLEGDAREGLQRASDREGAEWLDWFSEKVRGYADGGARADDLEDVIAYLESAKSRSHGLLTQAPWQVCFADLDQGSDAVVSEVMRQLELTLEG
jgi:hypothetical protein